MKKFLVLICGLITSPVLATELSNNCPAGYHIFYETSLVLKGYTEENPVGEYTGIDGYLGSCWVDNPDDVCFLYAPTNKELSDSTGTLFYEEICPM